MKKTRKDDQPLDILFADVIDPNLRDERDTMEHPFFSLSKNKRTKPIEYEKNGIHVIVRGIQDVGIATIWDADFLIWAASQLNEAIEKGEEISRRLWFHPYKYLVQTRRMNPDNKTAKVYRDFEKTLRRLKGTMIETNIKANGRRIEEAWSWIDRWRVIKDEKTGKMTAVEVYLSDWLYERVVKDRAVLSIHEDYFILTGGIERWLYRIARKHCGNNNTWSFSLRKLYEKYPPGREYRFFKRDLKKVVLENNIPEYDVYWIDKKEGNEMIMFVMKKDADTRRKLPKELRKEIDVGIKKIGVRNCG